MSTFEKHLKKISKLISFCNCNSSHSHETNATLTTKSIERLSQSIYDNCEFHGELRLFDIGCSYGTFLLQAKDYLERLNKEAKQNEVKMYFTGCDNSKMRIMLGASFITRLIGDRTIEDLPNFRTLIFHQSILERTTLENTDIIYMYDKAFNPPLLIHCLLVIIKSKDVKWIITCKKGDKEFNFSTLIKQTKFFKVLDKIQNIRMAGSGESDTFVIYQKNHDVNNEFLTCKDETSTFLSRIGVKTKLCGQVIETYFGKEKNNFNVIKSHFSTNAGWETYYKNLGDTTCLTRRDAQRKCQLKKGVINYSDTTRKRKRNEK